MPFPNYMKVFQPLITTDISISLSDNHAWLVFTFHTLPSICHLLPDQYVTRPDRQTHPIFHTRDAHKDPQEVYTDPYEDPCTIWETRRRPTEGPEDP